MRVELPEFKRSFCCVPLRYGLVIWGYIRLLVVVVSFCLNASKLCKIMGDEEKYWNYVFTWITIVLEYIDFVIVIVFIIGAHKKNVPLLKFYFYFSLGEFIIQTLLLIGLAVYFSYLYHILFKHHMAAFRPAYISWGLLTTILTVLGYLLLQGYVLLLVRSEIKKLSSNCRFRFENNAANTKCVMQLEAAVENGKERMEHGEELNNGEEETMEVYDKQ